jgi:hypothetical protein
MRAGFWIALGVVGIAAVMAFWWSRGGPEESPEQLADLALTAPSADAQEQAAARLQAAAGRPPLRTGKRNPAQPYLGRVLQESRNPAVRAQCMQGLAMIWDYEHVPTMLEALDDDSPVVRAGAGAAIQALLAWDLGFKPNDPPAERKAAVARIQDAWTAFKKNKLPRWEERLEEKDKHPEPAGT